MISFKVRITNLKNGREKEVVFDTPSDQELGIKLRKILWELADENKDN